ncbi:Mediator of RNA polymerase II transcription subunit 14 [Gracilariopsis chorda]|uniref:Mediator of RNA polymerase II transcription subunit 14 n=1 Tax=Gracilariopsis chorda TaxID=448386 RepID=A0A2V3J2U4_9FLOR|nr:Mediator of RNA polymerase II transcription subunit 14 [Gracilariopsis chorda]|eukprot:PXF48653.1 Mediator of RNA polymerase II transcription subunit 14 [Gracilariopsis chorda]
MEAEREDIPLSRLTHDVVQNSYKELHALLDSLADYEPEDRQSRLLDAILNIRHRFARLSATVKWYMAYSAFHSSARIARRVCNDRSTVFTLDADTLWHVSANTRAAAAHPSAIQEAAQVLSGALTFNRLPRIIETFIGLEIKRDMRNISRIFFPSPAVRDSKRIQAPVANHSNHINSTTADAHVRADSSHVQLQNSKQNAESSYLPVQTSDLKNGLKDVRKPVSNLSESGHEEFSDEDVTTDAVERLRVTTRHVIRSSLPEGVKLIKAGVDPCAAAVRIGVPDAWTADVILDKLKLDQAFVVLLRFQILVDSHPDAPSTIRSRFHDRERPVPLLAEHREPLRQMLRDRMLWAYEEAKAANENEHIPKVLLCLAHAMSFECCGKLAMNHVRAQTIAFHKSNLWKYTDISFSGVGSDKENDSPVRIQYWLRSHLQSSVVITLVKNEESNSLPSRILQVEHGTEMPVNDFDASVSVKSINIEALVLKCCRTRAVHELQRIRSQTQEKVAEELSIDLNSSSRSSVCLLVHFGQQGVGISFGISLRSGGFFVRATGPLVTALSRGDALANDVRKELWNGERFSKGRTDDLSREFETLLSASLALLKSETAVRSALGGSADVMIGWPPGASSVETPEVSKDGRKVNPPFAAIEKKRPRRFMTLSSIANEDDEPYMFPGLSAAKRARSMPLPFTTSSDGYAFIQGRHSSPKNIPRGVNSLVCSSSVMADWMGMRNMIDMRLRRDHILRELEFLKVATPVDGDFRLQSSHRTPLKVKSSPMKVEESFLNVYENGTWEIELTLANELFDEHNYYGQVVSFSRKRRSLRFRYPDQSLRSIQCFARDVLRARTAAALINGLNAESNAYRLTVKLPSHIQVRHSKGITFTVGLCKRVVEIQARPHHPLVSVHFVPFAEEILQESAMEMGKRLGELLEMSLPMFLAIQSALPADRNVYKVRFTNALKARVIFGTANRRPFAIDVDARHGKESVMIYDVPRALQTIQSEMQSVPYSAVPIWPQMIEQLVEKRVGKMEYGGAAVRIPVTILGQILHLIAKKAGSS